MKTLLPLAERVGEGLKARKKTVAIAESSSGGLLSAALLSVPGASAYFYGGVVSIGRRDTNCMGFRASVTRMSESIAGLR
jgi:nicotinamide mononucleotide (NMN) deamidase PncC